MPTVKLHKGLIVQFVRVVDDRDGLVPDRLADPVDPGDQDKPAGDALARNRRHAGPRRLRHLENNTGT
jgi:hypothetical protein